MISFNPLTNNISLDWFNLKACAHDKINVNENLKFVVKGRKYCVKRRKCWLPAFSPFPSIFSIGFSKNFRL